MSYLRNRIGRRQTSAKKTALGDIGSTLSSLIGAVESGASAAANVASDPYLPEVLCRIGQLKSIESHQVPAVCSYTPSGLRGGIGLGNAIVPLRAYVYAQENKWVYPVAIGAVLGLPFFLGYMLGKG